MLIIKSHKALEAGENTILQIDMLFLSHKHYFFADFKGTDTENSTFEDHFLTQIKIRQSQVRHYFGQKEPDTDELQCLRHEVA